MSNSTTPLSHTPALAAAPGNAQPARSLILAGGGMRVAYQAGVLKALHEADLRFFHADGTSGGTMNLGMLLSGLSPNEMCQRWRTLQVTDFSSLMPPATYLKPLRTPALGDADGIVNKVFPHLGIDPARIQAATGMAGTFNVCNYTKKVNEAIAHTDIELDLLVAGISLPIFMPPVPKNGCLYLDSVWIKDANLVEAVKRGAEELWLVWCIGNTASYRAGAFNQYVHMIEISAGGALNLELEWIAEVNARIARGEPAYGQRRPITLHVIKPEFPLPLDPDFFFGRIDAATLIDMGYRDAMGYLKAAQPTGVTLTPEATKMKEPSPGVSFRETMAGGFMLGETDPLKGCAKGNANFTQLSMHATIDIRDIAAFVSDPQHQGAITGHIDFAPLGYQLLASHGVFKLFAPSGELGLRWMVYELGFQAQGKSYYLAGKKEVRVGSILRMWSATTTLFTTLYEGDDTTAPVVGAGVLSLGVGELLKLGRTLHATNTASLSQRIRTVARFFSFFASALWQTYVRKK
jgi:predicted acylesterase/phospholipase RssA